MKRKSRGFIAVDVLLLALAILPLIGGMVLKILTNVPSDDITITGAQIYFTIDLPIQPLPITAAQINSWLVMATIFFLALYLTHGICAKPETRRQLVAEWIVEKSESLVKENMDPYFRDFGPLIGTIMALSAFSSLSSLVGLFPPTSDLNVVAGWALMVFILITYYKMKCGLPHYLKSFAQPVLMTPLNVISEVATPVSMTFRHYGNVLSGSVISVLIAALLQTLSRAALGWLPGVLGEIPFFQIGLPAILSLYFDVFSGCLQAFIFAMLTMLYISGGFPADEYAARQEERRRRREQKAARTAQSGPEVSHQ